MTTSTCPPSRAWRGVPYAERRLLIEAAIMDRLAHGEATLDDIREATRLKEPGYLLTTLTQCGRLVRVRPGVFRLPTATEGPRAQFGAIVADRADRVGAVLLDLQPHRAGELAQKLGLAPDEVSKALALLVSSGRAVRIGHGVYAATGAFPEGMPVSTRDPLALSQGEARALRYLISRLLTDQHLGLAALESLAAHIAAESGLTADEADATVALWMMGLIHKGRVEVRDGARLRLIQTVSGDPMVLMLASYGLEVTDHVDDGEPGR